jgi:hypothetical protein
MVMTKAVAGIGAEAKVIVTLTAVVAVQVPVSWATLLVPAATADGVTDGAKKPEG